MKNAVPLIILFILVAGGVSLIGQRSESINSQPTTSQVAVTPSLIVKPCTPTFLDGGGPYYQPNSPFRTQLAPTDHDGENLVVSGKVVQNDCVTPLADVVVDIWQANESGSYEDEWYRGQVRTNAQGEYRFSTVVPKGYGEGTAFRPPHIHFKVWQAGKLLITSQMFLPESRAQGIEEPYIMAVTTNQGDGVRTHTGYHDIVLP